jgi:hypothetical protein
MSERDILNRISLLYQQLELINLYEEEFLEILGKEGYFKKINDILDEINHWRNTLKEMRK